MADLNLHGLQALRQLDRKNDATDAGMRNFMQRQADGEQPDPAEFEQLMGQRMAVRSAMAAQTQLYEKPLKTVLSEAGH